MKRSKLFVYSIAPISVLSSTLMVVSCSSKEFYSSQDIGGLNTWLKSIQKENAIKTKADKINENYKQNPDDEANKFAYDLLNQKTIQISTGGKVNDQSFNQLVWETISAFSKSIGNNNNRHYETQVISQETQNVAYDYAIANGYKIWILTGFQQGTLLSNWLKIGKNEERFNKAGIKVITVDWYDPSLTIPGRLLGLNFKTQESSFTLSYAAAKLLSEIYPGNENVNNRYFNSFGGGDFSGVTNFNYGFYEGLRMWNSEQTSNENKVMSTTLSKDVSVDLTTGFSITNDSRAKVNNAVDGYNGPLPKIIMPVAGSLTSVAIDRAKEKNKDQWIVGVDTDMSLTFPTNKGMILTSSEKKIAIAVYKALSLFYGLNEALDNDGIACKLNYDEETKETYISSKTTPDKAENINVVGGYKEGFVDVSKSTLDPNKYKFESGKTYAQRYDEIVSETWNKFFINPSTSLEANKPSEELLKKGPIFYNNVFYGEMIAGNLNNYFNPAILGGVAWPGVNDEYKNVVGINSWKNNKLEMNHTLITTINRKEEE